MREGSEEGGGGEEIEERDRERYTIRGHTISTEINQGCAQISKRKITKINRPDVRCDKKRDSLVPFFFLFFFSFSPDLPHAHAHASRAE